jgi:MFS family permease
MPTQPFEHTGARSAMGLLALLRGNRAFRRLFAVPAVSLVGDWFSFVALSGLVYHLTGRPGAPALLFASQSLPMVALVPVAGAVADRLDRKRLKVACDLAAAIPVLGFLAAARWHSAGLAFGCVVLLSTLAALADPIPEAALPNLVAAEELSLAQTAMSGLYSVGLLLGAGLGGVVTATLGRDVTFLLDLATFVISALLILRIRQPFSGFAPLGHPRLLRDAHQLRVFVGETPMVRALLWLTVGLRLGYGLVGLLPAYALARFHLGSGGVGGLFLAQGVGAVVGPFLGRAAARDLPRRRLVVAGAFGLGYLALASATCLAVGLPMAAVAHLGVGASAILAVNGLQVATPDALRGRIMALVFGLSAGLQGLSAIVAARLADAAGLLWATRALALFAITYSGGWLLRTRRLWRVGSARDSTR